MMNVPRNTAHAAVTHGTRPVSICPDRRIGFPGESESYRSGQAGEASQENESVPRFGNGMEFFQDSHEKTADGERGERM